MFARKKLMAKRSLAILLAVMLVTYSIPLHLFANVLAESEEEAFTLQVVRGEEPVSDADVEVTNSGDITISKKTNSEGIATFPELTAASFGEHSTFNFNVAFEDEEPDTFSISLKEGTTDYYIYDVVTKDFKLKETEEVMEDDEEEVKEEEPTTYHVVVNQTGEGQVTINDESYSSNLELEEGTELVIEISPSENSFIESVRINGENRAITNRESYEETIESLSTDIEINVEFVLKTYTITFNYNDLGEIVDENGEVISKEGKIEVGHGENKYFTVKPSEGYYIKTVKIDGKAVEEIEEDNFSYTFEDVISNHEVEVTFAIKTFTVTANVDGENGTISPSSEEVSYGNDLELEIAPNASYQVKAIRVNGVELDLENNPDFIWKEETNLFLLTLTEIKEDISVIVEFEEIPSEDGSWSDYIEIQPSESIDTIIVDGKVVYVYAKGERVKISPNKNSEYSHRININHDFFWWKNYTFTNNTKINSIKVGKKWDGKEIIQDQKLILVFDTVAPSIGDVTLQGENEALVDEASWFSGAVTVSGLVENIKQTFDGVEYSTEIEAVYYSKGNSSEEHLAEFDASTNEFTFVTEDEDYTGVYNVWAIDEAGNKSEVRTINIHIDKTNPSLAPGEAVEFKIKDQNFVTKALHFLSFGTFFNQTIEITVDAVDAASGIQEITLRATDEDGVVTTVTQDDISRDGLTATAVFTLEAPSFLGVFEVEVIDNVGNNYETIITKENSNIAADNNGVVMIEQVDPSVQLTIHHEEDNIPYEDIYREVVEFEIHAQDDESGLYAVVVDVNGIEITSSYTDEKIMSDVITLQTDDERIKVDEDGSYNISVEVIDNAGNVTVTSKTIFTDHSHPVITRYTFAIENEDGEYVEEEYSEELTESIELDEYGFYFKNKTRVTVTAEDYKRPNEAASGVQSITVYLQDHEDETFYAILEDGSYVEIEEEEIENVEPIATTGEFTFDVPENFKGQIFAKATDNVQNTGPFTTAVGTIVESLERHEQDSYIEIQLPETAYQDKKQQNLYADNIELDITVVDSYSSIETIEWFVEAPYDRENDDKGSVTLDTTTRYDVGTVIDGWELTSTHLNLVTEMKKTIPISRNSNDIVVRVVMHDRAGHVTEQEVTFSIDKVKPELEVIYDNDKADEEFPNNYDGHRVATIIVTERNFDPQLLLAQLNDERLELVWETNYNEENPDRTTHTANVYFTNDGDYKFSVLFEDMAGNEAPPYTPDSFTIDTTPPEVTVVYDNNDVANDNFYKAPRTATITVKERNFDAARVEIIGSVELGDVSFPSLSDWTTDGDTHTATIYYEEDALYSFNIHARDKAGNAAANYEKETFYIDTTVPKLVEEEAVTFEQTNTNFFAKAINFLSFGTFFNKEVRVVVKAEDNIAGIESISLTASDSDVELVEVKNSFKQGENNLTAEAKFTINATSFTGNIFVELTDYSKNVQEYKVTSENSNIVADNDGVIEIEKNKPTAEINVIPNKGVSSNGKNVYSGDVTYEVVVTDADSGVNTVKIDINGKEYLHDYSSDKEKRTKPIKYSINLATEDIPINKDGSYEISVYVIDNAGNSQSRKTKTYKDETSPIITDFIFSNKDVNGSFKKVEDTDEFKKSVELTQYGFYFKQQTRVTVKAEDPEKEYEYTSGLQSIVVYLKDYDNGKYYSVLRNGDLKEIKESDVNKISPIATKGEVSFLVPVNFKGQIFAKAIDGVDNTVGFETPDGTIVESAAQHAKETHIDFKVPTTTYQDNNGQDLYANNVNVELTVTDTYSGIAQIEWSVVAPYDRDNNESGSLTIHNDKTYSPGSNSDGWRQTKQEKNLVTEMKKTLTVRNNSNDIVVKVKMTDRSGHTSEDEITFSIDKTTPTIEITYDNNTPDGDFTDYYKANRTATIVVTERNFRPEDVEYVITNTLGERPSLAGWNSRVNRANPDLSTHTATISFTADGDYTFDMKYQDNARNAAAPVPQQKFTIDKTEPVINVAYSSSSAQNGNYYNTARTATISIKERNFETSRIQITGTATDDGSTIAFPEVSRWNSVGDVHTATIHYGTDGLYTFDIAYTDMAGNVAAEYTVDEFYVDQTAPELTISGVEHMSANNGEVIPVISYRDTNFNPNNVTISLTGANRGPVELVGSYSDEGNGQVFTFENFEEMQEVDDLYTLTATVVDYAGNESTEEIRFSVNRFGSVYTLDESTVGINGKYVQDEVDIILTETNVDSIDEDSVTIVMTKNGTPTDLMNGTDYTVEKAGGEGSWSQYTYTVKKDLFAGDGRYTVTLYSEDAAGNINENIDETKKAEISFGIDKTAPVIVPIDLESGAQYPVETKAVTVSIKDNLVLDQATIFLNNEEVDYEVSGEDYTFDIPSSNAKQSVTIVAVDAAGNELNVDITDLLVSTNLFVRWYNNTSLFYGSLIGIGAISTSIAGYFVFRKRKEDDDDTARFDEEKEDIVS
ncbi:Ig-like domain-containing protein [Sutcliffiella cohnii]|uniref:Ig-like domain-containing protein n=1 Tax=Sutcliffiella cohnii TaxID=33932 RepID=UPI002E20C52E|nr:Ig-like domain-containing protein [Sutcliffiella cohnii]